MSNTSEIPNASEILMNSMITIDELITWSALTIQFSLLKQITTFKDADPNTPPHSTDLNVEIAYAILRTYANHYHATTLISDKGKPASDEYINNLINSIIGSDDDDDDFEQ